MSAGIALIWGASFLFISIAIDHVATPVVPMARLFFGVIALALIPGARGRIERNDVPMFVFLGFSWMALPFLLYPLAEETVSSAVTGMINGGLPVMSVVVTAFFVRRVPSRQRVLAVLIGFSGIAVISFASVGDGLSATVHGVLFLVLALFCYSVSVNLAQPLQAKYGSLTTLLWVELIALVWTLPLGLPALGRSSFDWGAFLSLVALGAVGTGVAFALYGILLHRAGTVRGMIGTFFTPIVATILGVLFRNEHVHALAIVGMFIVIIGAVLTSRPE